MVTQIFRLHHFAHKSFCSAISISVPRQTRINLDRPLIDSARHALSFRESLLTQPVDDSQAASAVMAMDNDVGVALRFQFRDPALNLAHRQQLGLRNRDGLMFVRLATIQKHKLVAGIQPSLHLNASHFQWNGALWSRHFGSNLSESQSIGTATAQVRGGLYVERLTSGNTTDARLKDHSPIRRRGGSLKPVTARQCFELRRLRRPVIHRVSEGVSRNSLAHAAGYTSETEKLASSVKPVRLA